jgi:hypothetical protein
MCPSEGEDFKWRRDGHFAGWMGSHFLLGELITKRQHRLKFLASFFSFENKWSDFVYFHYCVGGVMLPEVSLLATLLMILLMVLYKNVAN